MIELRAVCKGFGNQSILEDINLSIADGERLCVIGQSERRAPEGHDRIANKLVYGG